MGTGGGSLCAVDAGAQHKNAGRARTRQNENAMRVAEWAESHPAFSRVHYPGLESHPDHELAKETLDGYGGDDGG